MTKMLFHIFLVLVFQVIANGLVIKNSENHEVDKVLKLTWDVLDKSFYKCTYVCATTSSVIFHKMKHNAYYNEGFSPLVSIYWPTGVVPDPPDVNSTIMSRDNPWPFHTDNRRLEDNCAVYLLTVEKGEDINNLLTYLSSIIYPSPTRDYFFIWNLSEDLSPEELLIENQIVRGLKFKTLVSFKDGQKLFTSCYFCKGGKPDVLQLDHPGQSFKDYARNLNQTFIRCIYIYPETPANLRRRHENGEVVNINYVNLELVSFALNFDWILLASDAGEGGAVEQQLADGSWVGFVGDVLYDKADLGVSTIMSSEVTDIVELSIPFYSTLVAFSISKPKPIYTWKIIVYPFTKFMWGCIFCSVFIGGLLFWSTLKLNRTLNMAVKSNLVPITFAFAYLAMPLIGTSLKFNPRTYASRAFLTHWLFYALIISVVYQSKLVAIMSVTRYEIIPETFIEVVDMNYRGGSDAKHALYMQFLLQYIEVEKIQILRDSLEGFDSNFDCLANALEHKLMCMTAIDFLTAEMMKFLDHNGRLRHNVYSGDGFSILGGMILKKHSPVLKTLNDAILRSSQSGLYSKALTDMNHAGFVNGLREMRERKVVPTGDGPTALTLHQLQGPFLILAFSSIVGLVLFLREQSGWRKSKRNQKHILE